MRVVHIARGAGKTTKALEWLMRNPRRGLIVMHEAERARIIRMWSLHGPLADVAARIVSAQHHHDLHDIDEVGVDNVDSVLAVLLWNAVGLITINRE